MSITTFELLIKEKLEIPYVNLAGLDDEISKEITQALFFAFFRYPALKKAICSVGDYIDVNNQQMMTENGVMCLLRQFEGELSSIKQPYMCVSYTANLSFKTIINIIKSHLLSRYNTLNPEDNYIYYNLIYFGLAYNDDLTKLKELTEVRTNPIYPNYNLAGIKGIVYHEIGHVLYLLLKFTKEKTMKFLAQFPEYEPDSYEKDILLHIEDSEEHFCYAFAEYMCAPDKCHPIIKALGEHINKEYELYKDSKRFNINWRYKEHLKRAEKEELKKKLKLSR